MPDLHFTFFRKPSSLLDEVLALRTRVFVDEQEVPRELEVDEYDEIADHLLARDNDGNAIGTLRILVKGSTAKIGRVAVSAAHRRQGVGTLMMAKALCHCKSLRLESVELDSQSYCVAFYRHMGFTSVGGEFIDAGIPHVHMVLRLAKQSDQNPPDV